MIGLYDIIEAANGQLFGEPSAQIFTEFCLSPEQAGPNMLYVAMRNDQGDSHRYIEEAITKGVAGVICVKPPTSDTTNVTVILVKDTVEAMVAWARQVVRKTGVRIIAVTGSSGRSATVKAIETVLCSRYKVHSSIVDYSDPRLNFPLAVSTLKPEHEYSIIRISSTQPGQLKAVTAAMQPDCVVVTALHHAYLEHFESIDELTAEYEQFVKHLPSSSLVILNYDDDRVRGLSASISASVKTMSISNFGADVMAFNVIEGLNGTGFDIRFDKERLNARWTLLLGAHQLYSILAAMIVGARFNISADESLRHLKDLEPLPGRMQPLIGKNGSILINDTHSANPESTLAALNWLENVKESSQRIITILGDMDNLGEYSQIGHRQVGKRVAEVTHILITEGAESTAIGRAALDGGLTPSQVHRTYSTQDVINLLAARYNLDENDLILVKGGKVMQMSNIVYTLLKSPDEVGQLDDSVIGESAMPGFQPTRPSWVEIDTEAIANNVKAIKRQIGDEVAFMAVVKADAYGHGAVVASQTALLNGADYLAVANLQEALDLRDAGIDAPILILSYLPTYGVRQAVRQNFTATVYDLDQAKAFDRVARQIGGKLKIHVKVDTGMGRLGVLPDNAVPLFRHLSALDNLSIEGIYTHFSSADDDAGYTAEQVEVFKQVIRPLKAGGFNFKYIHAANTPGLFASPDNHFTMARSGLALFGLNPSTTVPLPEGFKQAMTWKTVVAQVKTLPRGHAVGYGNTYITDKEETVAVIPVGYADGFRRNPNWGEVLIHGIRAPIRGRVSMEKTVVSVSHIPNVSMGDEVVLLGKQGDEQITAEEIAERLNTINYEVVCDVLARAARR